MAEIKIYNTLTRRKDPLVPRDEGKLGLYVCGPTVYDNAHLGHARAYVVFDTLVRFLTHRGYSVTYVRNITDLDDKIIRKANDSGKTCREVAESFTRTFHEDMAALNVRPPGFEPRATEHIPEMLDLISRLVDGGFAYRVDGDVYFSIEAFKPYGALSGRDLEALRVGARVEIDPRLRHPNDFALWKASKEGEPSWDSPWGPGRPGWHIECSAMSLKYLGADFDIHGGGLDLVFPHHENEIAQASAALGRPFCRVFLHNGFVNVNREKMAKSKGNFFLIRQVLEHGHPEAIRLFLLGTHYRSPIDLQVDLGPDGSLRGLPQIAEAQKRVEYYYETIEKLGLAAPGPADPPSDLAGTVEGLRSLVDEALGDDFNTARAVAHLNDIMRTANEVVDRGKTMRAGEKASACVLLLDTVRWCGELLGLVQADPETFMRTERRRRLDRLGLTEDDIELRIAARRQARERGDWSAADSIRDELKARGIEIRDQAGATRWTVRGS